MPELSARRGTPLSRPETCSASKSPTSDASMNAIAIDLDGFADARHQALGEPVEHDVGIQVAGEADQRAAVVVPVAVERAIDAPLQAVLDRLGQQNHDDRGEERDDPPLIRLALDERAARGAEDGDEDRDAGGDRRGVDQQALEDDLDVHQPVADDRRGERHRDEPERNGATVPSAATDRRRARTARHSRARTASRQARCPTQSTAAGACRSPSPSA